jgi:hypothetical protein
MTNIFVTIDYDDGNGSSYRAVEIRYKNKKYRFDSGDVTVDWIDMIKWVSDKDFEFANFSSSVDHFVFDSKDNKWLCIDHDNGNIVSENGLQYIVNKEINNFEEHYAYYKSKKS